MATLRRRALHHHKWTAVCSCRCRSRAWQWPTRRLCSRLSAFGNSNRNFRSSRRLYWTWRKRNNRHQQQRLHVPTTRPVQNRDASFLPRRDSKHTRNENSRRTDTSSSPGSGRRPRQRRKRRSISLKRLLETTRWSRGWPPVLRTADDIPRSSRMSKTSCSGMPRLTITCMRNTETEMPQRIWTIVG